MAHAGAATAAVSEQAPTMQFGQSQGLSRVSLGHSESRLL